MKKLLFGALLVLLLLILLPPAWSALFPPELPDLPAAGTRVPVRADAAANVVELMAFPNAYIANVDANSVPVIAGVLAMLLVGIYMTFKAYAKQPNDSCQP